jgi:sugar phosphate permease
MSCWYKPFELAKRLAIFYTASLMSGAFGGLLAGAITGNMDMVGGVRGWKWLFVIEGIATVVLAVVAVFVLPDFPHSTNGLTDEERALAQLRLITAASNEAPLSHKEAFVRAMKDKKTWLLTLGYMGITSAGTISYFFPTLMVTLGYRGVQANLMTAPIYAGCLVICICVGFSSDKFQEKPYHVAGCTIVAAISFLVTAFVKNSAVRYTFILFGGAGIWSATPLFLSYALSNFTNREQRAVSIATINGLGNLASVYGSYIWPKTSGPRFIQGFSCTTAFVLVGGAATLANYWMVGDLRQTAAQDEADEEARQRHQNKPQQHKLDTE